MNPQLAPGLPRYEDKRKVKMSTMFAGLSGIQKHLKAVSEFFIKNQSTIRLDAAPTGYIPPSSLSVPSMPELLRRNRNWIVPRARDLSCGARRIRPVSVKYFSQVTIRPAILHGYTLDFT